MAAPDENRKELQPHPQVLLGKGDSPTSSHLQTLLSKIGYQIVVAEDGLEARSRLLEPDAPQLAILDVNMAGLRGIDLCRELRKPEHRQPYVILLTRWDEHLDRIAALEAGADDFLPSPVDVRELQLRLEKGSQALLARALRESKERFRSAFECAGIGMAVVKDTGELLQVNRALCEFLDFSEERLTGLNLCDLAFPGKSQTRSELLSNFFGDIPDREGVEKLFITRMGDLVWASYTISPVVDKDQSSTSFVLQVQDISQRKSGEEALRHNEAFLRAITDNVNDLIFVVNDENKWIYASPSHSSNLGYEPSELKGSDSLRLIHPDDRELVQRTASELFRDGTPKTINVRMQHKNGTWRHLEGHGTLLRNADGDTEGILVVARPIDDRILAEQKLQAAYFETEAFFQSIPSILIGLDSDGNITRWNQAAVTNLGISAQSVKGRRINDCGITWLHPDIKGEVGRWLRADPTYRCDNLSFLIEGRTRFLGLNVHRLPPLHDNTGAVFIVTGADITERRQLEEQLRQAQKLEAIGQLSAGVAHEINTPTQYVSDNVRFLKDSWPDLANLLQASQELRQAVSQGPATQEHLASYDQLSKKSDVEYMLKEVPSAIDQSLEGLQRIAHIVRAIKEFSHPGSAEKKGIDLNKAIETTITVARNEWKYVAELESQFDPELGLVPCLSSELNQVVLNLIVNAAHAIAERLGENSGGKGKITITTRRSKPWAEIDVQDTGQGIPAEIRSRIFEPFFTTKDVGKGSGQGLALAHSVVVTLHHGQIWFDSKVGLGTTFHIRIPLEAAAAVAAGG